MRRDSGSATLTTLQGSKLSSEGPDSEGPGRSDKVDLEARPDLSVIHPDKPDDDGGGGRRSKISIGPRVISDAILGLSDGLTVPFALTAGLSAFGNARLVVLGGLAELVAGAISMGLGGYVGAKSERHVSPVVRIRNPLGGFGGRGISMVHDTPMVFLT